MSGLGTFPCAAGLLAEETGRMVGAGACCHPTSQTAWEWQSRELLSSFTLPFLSIYHDSPPRSPLKPLSIGGFFSPTRSISRPVHSPCHPQSLRFLSQSFSPSHFFPSCLLIIHHLIGQSCLYHVPTHRNGNEFYTNQKCWMASPHHRVFHFSTFKHNVTLARKFGPSKTTK